MLSFIFQSMAAIEENRRLHNELKQKMKRDSLNDDDNDEQDDNEVVMYFNKILGFNLVD